MRENSCVILYARLARATIRASCRSENFRAREIDMYPIIIYVKLRSSLHSSGVTNRIIYLFCDNVGATKEIKHTKHSITDAVRSLYRSALLDHSYS